MGYGVERRCLSTGKQRKTCSCGHSKCGSSRCATTGKMRKICSCGHAKCGSGFCATTGKQRHRCSCDDTKCGNGLCPTTGKNRTTCSCGHAKCGGSRCPTSGKQRRLCSCGDAKCGSSRCPTSGKQRRLCNCGDAKCGNSLCPTSGKERQTCICGHAKCGGRICCHVHLDKNSGAEYRCVTLGTKPYDGYCSKCFKMLFPDDPRSVKLRRKIWEEQTETWLDEAGLVWSHSGKKLPCAPTTRYPDYLFLATEHAVLLEVDENEHKRYEPSCEVSRISEIMDSIDSMNLHVIRYNPHEKGPTLIARKTKLLAAIEAALVTNFGSMNDAGAVVQYLGYSSDRVEMLDELVCQMQQRGFKRARTSHVAC